LHSLFYIWPPSRSLFDSACVLVRVLCCCL
jgi:hypothetical protein